MFAPAKDVQVPPALRDYRLQGPSPPRLFIRTAAASPIIPFRSRAHPRTRAFSPETPRPARGLCFGAVRLQTKGETFRGLIPGAEHPKENYTSLNEGWIISILIFLKKLHGVRYDVGTHNIQLYAYDRTIYCCVVS